MGRAPCCDKASVKRGPWSPEEDAKLKAYIEEHGTGSNWIALPHKIGLKRCGKSCRLRWLNYLRPNIKHGGFSEDEDQIILNLYISIGSRWSIIAAQLPGRTDNDIKNYWNTRLKKKLLGKQRREDHYTLRPQCRLPANQPVLEPTANTAILNHETLSASALERLQLQLQLQGLHPPANFFINNPTALWPMNSLVPDTILESQPDAVPPNLLLQKYYARNNSSLLRISGQEDQDQTLGFSPSSSAGGGPIGGSEITPCSEYNSPVTGLQSSSSEGNQMHTESDYDLREIYGDHQKGVGNMGWCSSNDIGFEEKAMLMGGYSASSSLHLDSILMFQDQFAPGYDL